MKKSMFKLAAAERVLVCVMLFFSGRLLFAQSSLSAKDKALFEAAKSGTVADIKAALKNGANVNAMDGEGYTVLMCAAFWNTNPDVIKALIAAGADVNATRTENGYTALMYAALFNSNPDVIKALIAAGADVNARTEDGLTALMYAANNNPNPDVIKALIAAGADVNARDSDGDRAIDYLDLNIEIINRNDAYWTVRDLLY